MIFLTVGHQMPFDRLVRAVDAWALQRSRPDIQAQVGFGEYRPMAFGAVPFLSPSGFREVLDRAEAVVAHAGTGTILAALALGKPLLVMPRLAARNETRNDHQLATALHFEKAGLVLVARGEDEIARHLDVLPRFRPRGSIASTASPKLLERLRTFVFAGAHEH